MTRWRARSGWSLNQWRQTTLLASAVAWVFTVVADDFQGSTHQVAYEEEPIRYSQQTPDDAVARLQKRIDQGEVQLKFDPKFGYLPSVLEALKIPRSSQMLVFSKTSQQRQWINPHNPRGLYFNDDVYVGYIPGAPLMEVAAADPRLGGVFYTLDQAESTRPKFRREAQCLQCHGESRTLGVPGFFVRSIATDETGELDTGSEVSNVTDRTPLADRWAGWYVTGMHGNQSHRGNLIGADDFARHEKKPAYLGNLSALDRFFDQRKFPAAGSDIVALMVLEHQARMHDYITRLGYETRIMMATYGHIRYLNTQVNAFLRYLLFTEEAPLSAMIRGNPEYAKAFEAQGPRDSRGRSLRDLDLKTRLFKYPCSFLIYAESFDQMPGNMRETIYRRLWDILHGEDRNPDFGRIAASERSAILEILRETKAGLPAYWKVESGAPPASREKAGN